MTYEANNSNSLNIIDLRTNEIPIPCVYYPNHTKNAKLMIYFHGIGEDLGRVVEEPHLIRKHAGYSVLAVEYPGYGLNFYKGICTEKQMMRDSYSVLDFVLAATGLKMQDLVVFGRSIGTGVAANLAWQMRHDPFYKVVLVSPYFSIRDVFRTHAGCCGAMLVKDYFNTGSKISEINAPVLIIHGDSDPLIPIDHGQRLCDLCRSNSKLDSRPRVTHIGY